MRCLSALNIRHLSIPTVVLFSVMLRVSSRISSPSNCKQRIEQCSRALAWNYEALNKAFGERSVSRVSQTFGSQYEKRSLCVKAYNKNPYSNHNFYYKNKISPLAILTRGGSTFSPFKRPEKEAFSTTTRASHSESSYMSDKSYDEKLELYSAYIAVGSNMGDRFGNIMKALVYLEREFGSDETTGEPKSDKTTIVNTSYLHETAPMYVTDQASFLNGVIEIKTTLSPHILLRKLKQIESKIGRDLLNGPRYGPRPVDLDIVLYLRDTQQTLDKDKEDHDSAHENDNIESQYPHHWTNFGLVMNSNDLIIPHPRMQEREFVLLPLCELAGNFTHPVLNQTMSDLMHNLISEQISQDETNNDSAAVRVLPLPRGRMLRFTEVIVMGILNVTPDSFSDGGKVSKTLNQTSNFQFCNTWMFS